MEHEMKQENRGGPGRGQGRKAADGAQGVKSYKVTLDEDTLNIVKEFGNGAISVGIRKVAKIAKGNGND